VLSEQSHASGTARVGRRAATCLSVRRETRNSVYLSRLCRQGRLLASSNSTSAVGHDVPRILSMRPVLGCMTGGECQDYQPQSPTLRRRGRSHVGVASLMTTPSSKTVLSNKEATNQVASGSRRSDAKFRGEWSCRPRRAARGVALVPLDTSSAAGKAARRAVVAHQLSLAVMRHVLCPLLEVSSETVLWSQQMNIDKLAARELRG